MRCLCCNRNLDDYESTMRHPVTNEFLDICAKCLPDTGITPIVRSDLKPELTSSIEEEDKEWGFEHWGFDDEGN